MKSLLRMPRINNSANIRIVRTTGIRQQRRYSFCYPRRIGRFARPIISYRDMPVPVLIVLTHNQINLHEIKHGNIPHSNAQHFTNTKKTRHPPPPKKKSKQQLTAKDADSEFKLNLSNRVMLQGLLGSFEHHQQRPSSVNGR